MNKRKPVDYSQYLTKDGKDDAPPAKRKRDEPMVAKETNKRRKVSETSEFDINTQMDMDEENMVPKKPTKPPIRTKPLEPNAGSPKDIDNAKSKGTRPLKKVTDDGARPKVKRTSKKVASTSPPRFEGFSDDSAHMFDDMEPVYTHEKKPKSRLVEEEPEESWMPIERKEYTPPSYKREPDIGRLSLEKERQELEKLRQALEKDRRTMEQHVENAENKLAERERAVAKKEQAMKALNQEHSVGRKDLETKAKNQEKVARNQEKMAQELERARKELDRSQKELESKEAKHQSAVESFKKLSESAKKDIFDVRSPHPEGKRLQEGMRDLERDRMEFEQMKEQYEKEMDEERLNFKNQILAERQEVEEAWRKVHLERQTNQSHNEAMGKLQNSLGEQEERVPLLEVFRYRVIKHNTWSVTATANDRQWVFMIRQEDNNRLEYTPVDSVGIEKKDVPHYLSTVIYFPADKLHSLYLRIIAALCK